jgi:subtilisin-like proprotein convertase family protein
MKKHFARNLGEEGRSGGLHPFQGKQTDAKRGVVIKRRNMTGRAFFLSLVLGILCFAAVGGMPVYADVSGSELTGVTPVSLPLGTFDITFTVHFPVDNTGDYMDRFDVTVPADWTINSVYHKNPDTEGVCVGITTTQGVDGHKIYWQTDVPTLPSYCGAWSGEGDPYTFTANVTVPSCPAGPVSLDWNIYGDNYGDAPHTTSGSFSPNFSCMTTAPNSPSGVKAVPGGGQAIVSFVPGYDGGSPITGYTVTSSPGAITATGSSSPILFSGLTNGTEYTFTVEATNAIGTGPASDPSNIVTPRPGLIGSSDVPRDIPDNDETGVSSTLDIDPGACSDITDLNVAVNISHTWVGDLIVTLTHNGTSAVIIDRPGYPTSTYGCEGNGIIDAVLDDSASNSVENSSCTQDFLGTFSPNTSLSIFNGGDASGTWSLTVSDVSEGDVGSLNSWGLILSCGSTNAYTLTVNRTGSGTVTASPGPLAWYGSAGIATYDQGTSVDITTTPSDTCGMVSYTGSCVGNTYLCSVMMTADRTVNVAINTYYVWIEDTGYFASMQDAYDAAYNGDVLRSKASYQTGDLLFDGDKQVTIKGGFTDCAYSNNAGSFTPIGGSMTIGGQDSGAGSVTIENIAIE